MNITGHAEKSLNDLVHRLIYEEELPGFLEKSLWESGRPSDNWSFMNRLIMFCNGTEDARSFNAWRAVGRYPKAGTKAFYILAPVVINVKVERLNEETGQLEEVDEPRLIGFRGQPEHRYEDTQGKALPQPTPIRTETSKLPLKWIADKMGTEIKFEFSKHGEAGSTAKDASEIRICADDLQTWFHELSHAVDIKLNHYQKDDYAFGEIVAELSACFLMHLYGDETPNMKFTKNYIEGWAGKGHVGLVLIKAATRVLEIYRVVEQGWFPENTFVEAIEVDEVAV